MIPWLELHGQFPPLEDALREPNGLLCAGGDLSPERIIDAYLHGIFPWFSKGEPILWWSPDPRMVLKPEEFKLSRSLRKTLKNSTYEVRLDYNFAGVIAACAKTKRKGQNGTWITHEIQAGYGRLHELGLAHSVETWVDNKLVGGLYGIAIGCMFYGESMFAHVTDASKIALAHLVMMLKDSGFGLIDCQMNTGHLASLGGKEIPREEFITRLEALVRQKPFVLPHNRRWPVDAACRSWA